MIDPYFEGTQPRQILFWAVAARRQMDRWEPLVVEHLSGTYPDRPKMAGERIWLGELEHHFSVVALDHMLDALKLWPNKVRLPDLLSSEVAEVRDLSTHWIENMPIFNTRPRPREPKFKTGRSYAARNPTRTPYDWFAWDATRGALLTPNVAAEEARAATQRAVDAVLLEEPQLARFVPPVEPSPWERDDAGRWWPPKPS